MLHRIPLPRGLPTCRVLHLRGTNQQTFPGPRLSTASHRIHLYVECDFLDARLARSVVIIPTFCAPPWVSEADGISAAPARASGLGPSPVIARRSRLVPRTRSTPTLRRPYARRTLRAAHAAPTGLVQRDRGVPRAGVPAELVHQGDRAGSRASSSTRSGSSRGCRCSTSGAGRVATRWRWPGAGITVHGVDLSPDFIELARERAAAESLPATFEVLDVRELAFAAEFDAAICLCQGGFGLLGGDDEEDVIRRIARAVRPGGAVALSAFSAVFAIRWLEDGEELDPRTGVLHEHANVRNAAGEERVFDLWTTCFTVRELSLLARAAGLTVTGISGVHPGEVRDPPADPRASRAAPARTPARSPVASIGSIRSPRVHASSRPSRIPRRPTVHIPGDLPLVRSRAGRDPGRRPANRCGRHRDRTREQPERHHRGRDPR